MPDRINFSLVNNQMGNILASCYDMFGGGQSAIFENVPMAPNEVVAGSAFVNDSITGQAKVATFWIQNGSPGLFTYRDIRDGDIIAVM